MAWPGPNELQEALQHPERAFTDRELRDGKIALNQFGLPLSWSGNFATVFQVMADGNQYAVRCFTHNPLGKQNRYEAIDRHLKTNGRPATFVDFDYQESGLICRRQEYPLIRMPWINGQTLDEFTYANISKADVLERLASKWYEAATELQRLPIAHNDLQHGNVMVEQGSRASIKLVDYDSLYVPHFANQKSPENGHRHYQHPRRDQSHYGPDVDNFPALVIYTSLIALARDQGAKARRATPESLLFAQADLQEPQNSRLFKYLEQSSDQQTAQLAKALSDAAKGRVADTPTLEQASGQRAKKALPSWLNPPTLPNTPPWTATGTVAPPVTASPPQQPAGTPSASQDPDQHNRNLVDEELQGIGKEIKPAVIRYAKQMRKTGWEFQSVRGVTGKHIRTIKALENTGPDATALGAVLLAILAHQGNNPLSNIGMSETKIRNMITIRNEHAHSTRDFSDQDYVDGALKTLKDFRRSIDKLPRQLPQRPYGNQGQLTPPTYQRSGSQPGQTGPRQQTPPLPIPPSSYSTGTLAREQIPAITLLLSTVFTVVLAVFIATPRISIQDWSLLLLLVGVIAIIGSGYLLWQTSDREVDLLLKNLNIAWTFVCNGAKSFCQTVYQTVYQTTGEIQNHNTKLVVRIGLIIVPIVIMIGIGIYLSKPNVVAVPPDPNTASTEKAPTSTPIPNNPQDLAPLPAAVPNIPLDDASHVQQISSLVNEYAHCNRAYSDQEAKARAQAITQVIQTSATTIDEIRRIVHEECPPIPVNDDAAEPSTPHLTTTSALFHQTLPAVLPSTDQPSTPNPTAIPDVPIPTVTPAPSPTPNPYHLSTSLKPSTVQQLYDADGRLLSSQNYEIAACYYDPHNTGTPRKWKLFTQPDQSLLEPVFAIHFNEPINLQHGLCYDFNVSFLGPTEWRVCASQPYGGNCDHNSSDFLWEREIPAFRGTSDSATYLWSPPHNDP